MVNCFTQSEKENILRFKINPLKFTIKPASHFFNCNSTNYIILVTESIPIFYLKKSIYFADLMTYYDTVNFKYSNMH